MGSSTSVPIHARGCGILGKKRPLKNFVQGRDRDEQASANADCGQLAVARSLVGGASANAEKTSYMRYAVS
jgi:hypothetical protein